MTSYPQACYAWASEVSRSLLAGAAGCGLAPSGRSERGGPSAQQRITGTDRACEAF